MKKCPFCNAVLTDEANFCLYCMTSLDDKKKTDVIRKNKSKALPVFLIITAALLTVSLSFAIFTKYSHRFSDTPVDENGSAQNEVPLSDQVSNDYEEASGVHVYPEILYTYRPAVIGDDYSSAYIPDENDIIITGVETVEITGIYYIPDHIDGKRVLGIDPLAFSDENVCDTVKKVIVADKIKTVWNNAFASCVNMSDIYLMGEAIYIDNGAFSQKRNGNLTIHCSETCDDRDFRLYKNNAEIYDAVYEYWDGGVVT